MGVKFANPPLELGLKYHDPPHLTELKEKCSRLFKVQDSKPTRQTNEQEKKRKQKQNKSKAKKARAKRMEANCKGAIETILHLGKNRVILQSLLAHYFFIMKEKVGSSKRKGHISLRRVVHQ